MQVLISAGQTLASKCAAQIRMSLFVSVYPARVFARVSL